MRGVPGFTMANTTMKKQIRKITALCSALTMMAGLTGNLLPAISVNVHAETSDSSAECPSVKEDAWTLENGVLTLVTPEGLKYENECAPWDEYRDYITEAIVEHEYNYIPGYAFSKCKNLKKVTLHDDIDYFTGYAFEGCTSLEEVTLPGRIFNLGIESFSGCTALKKLEIPASVKSFTLSEISGSGVTELIFNNPECEIISDCTDYSKDLVIKSRSDSSVQKQAENLGIKFEAAEINTEIKGTIGENAEWSLKDGTLTVTGSGELYFGPSVDNTVSSDGTPLPGIIEPAKAPWAVFNERISDVVIGEGIKNIPDQTFFGTVNIRSVTLPDTMEQIGEMAFADCVNITEITLPESINEIRQDAFMNVRDISFKVYSDSYALKYAQDNNLKYEIIDREDISSSPDTPQEDPKEDNEPITHLPEKLMSGDVNADNKRDVTDLTMISLYCIREQNFAPVQFDAADLDKDAKVTLADLAYYRQYISHISNIFQKKSESLSVSGVIELSNKEEINWSDLDSYYFEQETASGTIVKRSYCLDNGLTLTVTGESLYEKPESVFLSSPYGETNGIDIREKNVAEYLNQPVLAIVYENYAWQPTQNITVVNGLGEMFFRASEDEEQFLDLHSEGVSSDETTVSGFKNILDTAYLQVKETIPPEIMSKIYSAMNTMYSYTSESLPSFPDSYHLSNDYGEDSLYLIRHNSFVSISELGDGCRIRDDEASKELVDILVNSGYYFNESEYKYYQENKNKTSYSSEYNGRIIYTTGEKFDFNGTPYMVYLNYGDYGTEEETVQFIRTEEEYRNLIAEAKTNHLDAISKAADIPENYFEAGNRMICVQFKPADEEAVFKGLEYSRENPDRFTVNSEFISQSENDNEVRYYNMLICIPSAVMENIENEENIEVILN